MRLPKVELRTEPRMGPGFSATVRTTIWPGLVEEVRLTRLARRPDAACCSRREVLPSGRSTYVVTLYSKGQPFASFYLCTDWS